MSRSYLNIKTERETLRKAKQRENHEMRWRGNQNTRERFNSGTPTPDLPLVENGDPGPSTSNFRIGVEAESIMKRKYRLIDSFRENENEGLQTRYRDQVTKLGVTEGCPCCGNTWFSVYIHHIKRFIGIDKELTVYILTRCSSLCTNIVT
ncbi:uncharacterized protein EV154DRAFT_482540 [Mucor mucedo]|uniref:uncharacterized protein n=1 Tax=Mucor mucedo TaxID=29922 RepID=UPI00221EEBB3|nr:uncharacterized protein EV154DRAFT_482540 [Mucor mucedo]KAI7890118.1 hypothetical protein EV154DRAFT_482540 [Mucor mucedo]